MTGARYSPGLSVPSQVMPNAQRRPRTAIVAVPVLLVVVTFLFWYQTWFGRRLSNREIGEYLADTSVPHKTQHALAQMAERMTHGDESVKQWYPQIAALARNPQAEFRLTAAWVMGQDNRSEEFHQALRELLQDAEPTVRWNAALALVRFGDSAGEPQLRIMLRPFTLQAPQTGTVNFVVKKKDAIRTGSVVARIKAGTAKPEDVRSPLEGEIMDLKVPDGTTVARDEPLALLSPREGQVWESLRGLYFVGGAAALEDIERFVRDTPRMPERMRQQAESTIQAIRGRTAGK